VLSPDIGLILWERLSSLDGHGQKPVPTNQLTNAINAIDATDAIDAMDATPLDSSLVRCILYFYNLPIMVGNRNEL